MTQEEDTDVNVANGREGVDLRNYVIWLGVESYDDRSFWWLQGKTEQGKKIPSEFARRPCLWWAGEFYSAARSMTKIAQGLCPEQVR